MAYNILGLNISHNGSACVVSNGKVIFYLEADRWIKNKHCSPTLDFIEIISKKFLIDKIVLTGLEHRYNFRQFGYLMKGLNQIFPNTPITNLLTKHHLTHSFQSFFNSGFDKCLSIVIDGTGSIEYYKNNTKYPISETESIYEYDNNRNPALLYKNFFSWNPSFKKENISNKLTIGMFWEEVCKLFKWHGLHAGKIMGLSSYGKFNKKFNSLYKGNHINSQYFNFDKNNINKEYFDIKIKLNIDPQLWHFNPSKISNLEKDLAYHVQQETQQVIGNIIEKYLKKTNHKKVCCSGGYFLNCVSNYYLTKRFPDIEFYFEPISHDGGTAIGGALYVWYLENKIKPSQQKTLYLGPKYSKEQLLEGIKKYVSN